MYKYFLTSLIALFIGLNFSFGQLQQVQYKDGKQILNGYFVSSSKSKKGIIILPAWKGVDREAKEAALNLQKEGYMSFIADIYGEGNYPKSNEDATKSSSYYKNNFKEYQNRIKLALDQFIKLGADANNIVIIGYCFGGTGALEAARGLLPAKAIVSIHGGLKKERPNSPIQTKVLVLHGAEDASVKEEDVEGLRQELKQANADWQLIYYANSKHTWTDPESKDYNEVMAKRMWQHLLLFLRDVI